MNGSWSRAKPLVLLPAHANSVRWICMSVGLIPADCRMCLSLSLRLVCVPENGRGPHLCLFNAVTNPVFFASVCVCHAARGTQAARMTLWPTRGLERRSFSLLSVYQHNAAHRDKWRLLLWYRTGVFRGLDYQHFYEAFSFPLWCIVLVMATGTQQQLSQPHTVENQ